MGNFWGGEKIDPLAFAGVTLHGGGAVEGRVLEAAPRNGHNSQKVLVSYSFWAEFTVPCEVVFSVMNGQSTVLPVSSFQTAKIALYPIC